MDLGVGNAGHFVGVGKELFVVFVSMLFGRGGCICRASRKRGNREGQEAGWEAGWWVGYGLFS